MQFDFISLYMCNINFDLKIKSKFFVFKCNFKLIKRKRIKHLFSSLNIVHNVFHQFLFDSICLSVCRFRHYNSSNTLFVK